MRIVQIVRVLETGNKDDIATYITNTPNLDDAMAEAIRTVGTMSEIVNWWFPFTGYLMSITVSEITPPQVITDSAVIFQDTFCPRLETRAYLTDL